MFFTPCATRDPLAGFSYEGSIEPSSRHVNRSSSQPLDPLSSSPPAHEADDFIPQVMSSDSVLGRVSTAPVQRKTADADVFMSTGFQPGPTSFAALPSTVPRPSLSTRRGDSPWVTLFGFAPSQAASVRAQVESLLGSPIQETHQACGNFMHVRFRSASEAKNAIQLSGHLLDNGIMVGAVPCVSPALDSSKDEVQKPPIRTVSVPAFRMENQPSVFDPLWKVLDAIFEY